MERERSALRLADREIIRLLRFLIPEGSRVLEIGSTTGDVLDALKPSLGVGLDFSPKMVDKAREKFPHLQFLEGDAEDLPDELDGCGFDFVVMSDLVGHLDDVWKAFRELRSIVTPHTRVVITWYNFLWEPLLKLGEKIASELDDARAVTVRSSGQPRRLCRHVSVEGRQRVNENAEDHRRSVPVRRRLEGLPLDAEAPHGLEVARVDGDAAARATEARRQRSLRRSKPRSSRSPSRTASSCRATRRCRPYSMVFSPGPTRRSCRS